MPWQNPHPQHLHPSRCSLNIPSHYISLHNLEFSLSTPSLFMASSSSSSFFFPAAGTRSLFRVDTAGFPSCRRPTMTQLKKISKSCCIRADLDSNVSDMRTNGTPFPPSFLFLTLYLLILIYGFCSNSNFKYWFVILLVSWICESIFFSLLWLEVI